MSKIVKLKFKERFHSFNLDGWFDATEAAQRFNKRLDHWLDNDETLEYIQALDAELTGSESLITNTRKSWYLRTRRGHGGGTWLHPKLAVAFARWLNASFGVWCDLQIDAIIRNGIRAEGNVNLLSLYLRDTAAEWEVRFTPEYYHALARLTCTRYSGHSGGTPACYGQITDKWVYGCLLPPDVHAELKARRGDSVKMHQWLTSGGQGLLDKQIDLVTTFARSSADLRDFEARMMAVTQRGGQMGIIFPRAA
jgi:hypothetical protein